MGRPGFDPESLVLQGMPMTPVPQVYRQADPWGVLAVKTALLALSGSLADAQPPKVYNKLPWFGYAQSPVLLL